MYQITECSTKRIGRKLFSFAVALLMVAVMFPTVALAGEGDAKVTLSAPLASQYQAGQEFTISADIADNPGFTGAAIWLKFDNAALEISSLSYGPLFQDALFAYNPAYPGTIGYVHKDVATGGKVTAPSGKLFDVTFKVKAGATPGNYTIGFDDTAYPAGLGISMFAVSSGLAATTVAVDFSGTSVKVVDKTEQTVPVTGVSLSGGQASIDVGETFTLTATVSPANATNPTVYWSSSNPEIATVNSGVVTAVGPGKATITATTADGSHSASWEVTVEDSYVQKDSFEAQIFAGKARQDTAAKVALEAYPQSSGGAAGVIIANGEGQGQTGKFPDALAASSLAGLLDYPILLTAPDTLPSYTADALKKLNPQKIIILGDTKSISAKVVSALKANNPSAGDPVRLQGANRIDTAVAIYNYGKNLGSGWGKTAIFADAGNFPDALAIAPLAGNKHFPIFLVQGSSLSDSVKAVFTSASFSDAIIVGSSKSVSAGVAAQVKAVLGKDANRLYGDNRYQTAVKIAAYSVQNGLSYDKSGIATGENFPDALTGGPLLAKRGSVVLLAADGNTATLDLIKGDKTISKIHIFGDTPAVSTKIYQAIEDRLGLARGTIKK